MPLGECKRSIYWQRRDEPLRCPEGQEILKKQLCHHDSITMHTDFITGRHGRQFRAAGFRHGIF